MIRMLRLLCLLSLVQLLVLDVQGYASYKADIPNGDRVPHPCKDNIIWHGVGHQIKDGGGNRNKFGEDFAVAKRVWTSELCLKDSDGDGQSNGYELGDPDCTWTKNDVDPVSDHLSHPGVCEPWTDPKCQEQLTWVTAACEAGEFVCSGLTKPGVKNMTLQYPPTPVPAQETTYICMEFNLDTSGDFHLIATQPIVNNTNVMHHAVLFGCDTDTHALRDTPIQCGMVASRECQTILSIWSLGSTGECFHNEVGFKIGLSDIKRVALQFHWNNPTKTDQYMDSSGMILHYTNNKRQNDAGVLTIGADYLEIPGRTAETLQTSVCPGTCTSNFMTDKIYIVSAFNHMHYLGASQKIELFRNGVKIRDITNDDKYNYDSPVVHEFSEPIEVLPGDTLSTTCGFNSLKRDTVTYFGDATSSEMCYGFITYYPKENWNKRFCTSYKSVANCAVQNNSIVNGCDLYSYQLFHIEVVDLFNTLNATCSTECSMQCANIVRSNPCLNGDNLDYIYYNSWRDFSLGQELMGLISLCDGMGTTPPPVQSETTETTKASPDETTKVSSDETTKVSPDETTKVSPDETTKMSPDETTKETPKETPKETTKVSPDETTKDTPNASTKETPKETTKETPNDVTKESPKDTNKETTANSNGINETSPHTTVGANEDDNGGVRMGSCFMTMALVSLVLYILV